MRRNNLVALICTDLDAECTTMQAGENATNAKHREMVSCIRIAAIISYRN